MGLPATPLQSSIQIQPRSLAEQLALAPESERRAFYDSLTQDKAKLLRYEWRGFWARPKQLMPSLEQPWDIWLVMAGRGFGKTRAGAEAIRELVMYHGYKRIALVARTAADARDVMVEGESGLLSVFPPWFQPTYEPSKRRITFPNGAIATTYSGDKPDQLRGPQHDAAWCDELAAWRYPQSWDQLQFGLRLGMRPLVVATTTPRPTPLMRELVAESSPEPTFGKPVILTTGSTHENALHLAPTMQRRLYKKYSGTRLGRQELDAELLTDTPGALWNLDVIEAHRLKPLDDGEAWHVQLPDLLRIAVAIDPPGSNKNENPDAAEAGIIAAAIDHNGHGYILDDMSIGGTPAEWARAALTTYHKWQADIMVGEVNNGGDMVEHTVMSTVQKGENRPNFKQVRASRGKAIRAEPVSALYEQGRVHHVGTFSILEDQLTTWIPGQKSPDRLDAAVWALTELMIKEDDDDDWSQAYASKGKRRRLGSYNPGRARG